MANLLSELVDLLEPFTRTVNERQALLARAFASEEYLKDIVWDGVSARTFVINTCKLLTNEQIDGKPALWHLLEVVRGDVDEEKQVLIDELQVQIAAFVLPIPTSKMRVFLSYARADDEPFVKHLYDDLVARGFTVWWDRVSMPNRGLTFLQEIRDAIDAADRFVLVAGEYAFQSDYVRVEWEYVLASCKPVNVALRKCAYVALPPELSNYDAPDFRDETSYPERLETLLRQLSEPIAPLGRLIGVPELPHKFLPRPSDMSRLRQLVIADVNKPTVISAEKRTTALEGMGGIGKSVLAAAFAYDCVVRRAFPHGIVWVNSGQKPSVRDLYQRLGVALGDNNANYPIDENICKTSVQNALNDKHCLIILDDVWELQVGKAFRDLIAGLPVRLLITTRQLLINDLLGAREHRVGLLDQAQAVELLSAWIGHDDPDLGKVAKQLGYLPLALKLAGARMFKDGLTGAEYATKFDRVSRMKLDRKSTERDENLDASIALGVEAVFGSDDVGKLLYYTFGIFPEDAHVPQMTVLRLWQHLRPDVEGFDLEDILTELVDLALVERYEDKTITLHDLLHSYTREKLGERYLQSQNDLLNAYNPDRAQPWHVAADVYLLDHMRHHMVEAGYKAEFYKLLAAGPDWMETKFRECSGDASYVTDLELAISDFRDPLDEDRLLSLVQLWAARQVVNARVVNCRDSDLEALVWLGRIKEALSYARLRNDYAEQLAGILTIHRTLEQRGTPLPSILDEAHMLLSRIQGKSEHWRSLI